MWATGYATCCGEAHGPTFRFLHLELFWVPPSGIGGFWTGTWDRVRGSAMICAILLLAGEPCPRWGRPSALLPVAGDCLVNHLARAAREAGGEPVLRVLGAHALAVAARRAPDGVGDVFNPDWARGSGAAIACGLRAALAGTENLGGVVIVPCEPPLMAVATLRGCVETVLARTEGIVQAEDAGSGAMGFGRAYFAELLALELGGDAREIVNRHLRHRVVLEAERPEASMAAARVASAVVEGVVVRGDLRRGGFTS